MDADPGYDTSNLKALRLDLERLNQDAFKSGLIALRDGGTEPQGFAVEPKPAAKSAGKKKTVARARQGVTAQAGLPIPPDVLPSAVLADGSAKDGSPATAGDGNGSAEQGKAAATRLLALLGRVTGDKSPIVLSTQFTEFGVVRLMAHLRKPRSRKSLFLRRLFRLLNRPVAMGLHTSAGISVEALQLVSRQLLEIEAHGWHYHHSRRAARRGTQAPPPQDLETPKKKRRSPAERTSGARPASVAKLKSAAKLKSVAQLKAKISEPK